MTIYRIISDILKELFRKEEAFQKKQIGKIIDAHIVKNPGFDGFRHMGHIYTHVPTSYRKHGKYNQLDSSLEPEMEDYMYRFSTIEEDRAMVRQALALILKPCKNTQDIRDALPDSLISLLPALQNLKRTKPENWSVMGNERACRQYKQLSDKIDYYVATHLIY